MRRLLEREKMLVTLAFWRMAGEANFVPSFLGVLGDRETRLKMVISEMMFALPSICEQSVNE